MQHDSTNSPMAISPAAQDSTPMANIYSQYKDLLSRYVLCRTELRKIFNEAETLRQENVNLRLANRDLMDQVNLLIEATLRSPSQTQQFSDSVEQYHSSSSSLSSIGGSFEKERDAGNWSGSFENERDTGNRSGSFEKERDTGNWSGSFSGKIPSLKTAIEKAQEENRKVDNNEKETVRVTLPKSISVRSAGIIGRTSNPLRSTARNRAPTPVVSAPKKVYVRGGSQKNGPTELEVYNQGMFKTELCNKWQETGSCPYGDHCQFAHGIAELRPVIRHPRYKTEVCRMVLSGDPCPYGHRCHFRHALTDEEKLMLSLELD